MNEISTTKWLRYLLYVGIAGFVHYLLGNSLLGSLSVWVGYILTGATVYLMFRLIVSNARYKKALLFSGAALIINLTGFQALAMAASICGIVGHFQEYYAHGELVAQQDPVLAGKWNNLFWFQFAVELIAGLLISMVTVVMVVAANLDAATVTAIVTVAIGIVSMILRVLYLIYLRRTIKVLETEFVM